MGVGTGDTIMLLLFPTKQILKQTKNARDDILRTALGEFDNILKLKGDLTFFNTKIPDAVKLSV